MGKTGEAKPDVIQNRIYTIRGVQVMIDGDLAELYGVETKRLNEQVKRNIERFPVEFCFQLTSEESEYLRLQIMASKAPGLKSQNAASNTNRGGGRYLFAQICRINVGYQIFNTTHSLSILFLLIST